MVRHDTRSWFQLCADRGNVQVGYLGRKHVRDEPDALRPWPVEGLDAVVTIAAGRSTAAVATANGTVYTWGSAPLGRTGDGFKPGLVQGLQGQRVVKVCMGEYHGVALTDTGAVFVWGSTGDDQVKDVNGVPLTDTAAPMRGLPSGIIATAVACGFQHTLLIGSACSGNRTASAVPGTDASRQAQPSSDEDSASTAAPTGVLPGIASLFSFAPTKEGLFAQPGEVPLLTESEEDSLDTAGTASPAESNGDASEATNTSLLATPVAPASHVEVPGLLPQMTWSVESCPNGPRPPWIAKCSSVHAEHALNVLDRAWLGRPSAPSQEQVRYKSLQLACTLSKGSADTQLRTQVELVDAWHAGCKVTTGRDCRSACVQLRTAAPDAFDEVKQPWLSSVKNPCYQDEAGIVRCLPYLSIIGVSKCGTTDLYKKLMLLKCAFHRTVKLSLCHRNIALKQTLCHR